MQLEDLVEGARSEAVAAPLIRALEQLEWPTDKEEQQLLSGFTTGVMVLGEVPGFVPKVGGWSISELMSWVTRLMSSRWHGAESTVSACGVYMCVCGRPWPCSRRSWR